jgi:anti-anti-sigma factor
MNGTPSFELCTVGDGRAFRLSGELDLATAAELINALHPLLRPGAEIRLELSHLAFIDSSGLRALVTVAKSLLPDGRLILSGSSGPVANLFQLVRADLIPGLAIDAFEVQPRDVRPVAS